MIRLIPPILGGPGSVGLLVLRIVAGSAMALHGWPKIQNPMGWMGDNAPIPGPALALAAIAEFGGGVCWVLGLLTPLASALILGTMAVAATTVHIKAGHPFVSTGGPSYELASLYLSIALMFLLVGPGKLSIDGAIFGRDRNP